MCPPGNPGTVSSPGAETVMLSFQIRNNVVIWDHLSSFICLFSFEIEKSYVLFRLLARR